MGRLQDIRSELDIDPLSRGYAEMGDAEAAADGRLLYRTRDLLSLTGSQVLNSIDKPEWDVLSDTNRQKVWSILHLGAINPFGFEADLFVDIFTGGSATIINLKALRKESVSRWVELEVGFVGHSDVEDARALP